ncbi:MAG: AAA family ATPase [Desulfobulbales bacterium]
MPAVEETKPELPVLYVFFGMIATGKSTLAQAWARHKQLPYYNSDRLRKELAGIDPTAAQRAAVDSGIYSREFSEKTYSALQKKAESFLRQGKSVVLDASYQYARNRWQLRDLAKSLHCNIYFILCRCPEKEMQQRMDMRSQDPTAVSDGRWEIYLQQKQRFEAPDELPAAELIIIDTLPPPEKLVEELDNKMV